MKKKANIKLAIGFFICILILSTLIIGNEQFSLERVQNSLSSLRSTYEGHNLLFMVLYMVVYVVIAALGIPVAAVLTLLAGAIFGFFTGTVLVSFASTMGATVSFLLSRFLFRQWIQQKFGKKLVTVQEGIARDGAYYLFTLRMIPIFPFFVINAVMGLTPIKTWTFYWVSQVGMLAGTMVYVNAGKQFGQIESVKGVLSWQVMSAFFLLGVFPILSKKMIEYFKRRGDSRRSES